MVDGNGVNFDNENFLVGKLISLFCQIFPQIETLTVQMYGCR